MTECLDFLSENDEFWTEVKQDGLGLSGGGTQNSPGLGGGGDT